MNDRAFNQSFLFVPGDRPERFGKALDSGADAVIVDLEDAVAPMSKAIARESVSAWLNPSRPVFIRVNAPATAWFEEDIRVACLPGIAGVVLPKAESADHVAACTSRVGSNVPVFPLVETGLGLLNALEIAQAPCTRQLLFGSLDFIADMGIPGDGAELNTYRAHLALASRVANLAPPIDGITPDIHDTERLTSESLNGKRLGFGGKMCIHPFQVAAVNACYRPSEADIAWAIRVVDAASRCGGGAVSLDGKMIDRPVVLRAQRILAITRT